MAATMYAMVENDPSAYSGYQYQNLLSRLYCSVWLLGICMLTL